MIEFFSVWSLIRTSGFLAFFFMTLALAFGLLNSFAILKKRKAMLLAYHQTSGWFGFLTIVFHMTLIWKDTYVPYSLTELLVPFSAKNASFFSALGTIAFYLFLIVIGSSDFFIKKLGHERWKKVHMAVIPAWVLMVVHGLTIGTDSSKSWAVFIYAAGIILILFLALFRYMESLVLRQSSQGSKNNKLSK